MWSIEFRSMHTSQHRLDPEHELSLQDPSEQLRDSYRGLAREFSDLGGAQHPFTVGFPNDDFPQFLADLAACKLGEGPATGFVPHSSYWLVLDGKEVVGVSNLRHCLNDCLRREGGNIGYGVRPSARGNGFAVELLRHTLERARQLGLSEVLITCAASNTPSVRTILRNGGVYESEEFLAKWGEPVQRYWISL